jgi:hypothetical protein
MIPGAVRLAIATGRGDLLRAAAALYDGREVPPELASALERAQRRRTIAARARQRRTQ